MFFGERLLIVVRDSVERVGVGVVIGEGVIMNENLRNIGNFFRRDIGGLGVWFGRRDIIFIYSSRFDV